MSNSEISVQLSLAAFPGRRHEDAIRVAVTQAHHEPFLGRLRSEHLQLVPQCLGLLDDELCESLMHAYPAAQLRLHANVRVMPKHVRADLSGFDQHADWFRQAARISRKLKASAYTAHAGSRSEASIDQVIEATRRAGDLFGHAVGIEGHYPDARNTFLVSTWAEYRTVFESGVPYALDMSHLNIVARTSRKVERTLVEEMLACERCIEIHVSSNEGTHDEHRVLPATEPPWWLELMHCRNPSAIVFSEGNHNQHLKEANNAIH